MPDAAVQFDSVTVALPDGRRIGPLTLRLDRGKKAVLVGASGSGKSTLLRCAVGLREPSEGSIVVEGQPMVPAAAVRLRSRIAFVGQEPEVGPGTGRESLQRPLRYRANRHLRYDERSATALLEELGLPAKVLDQPVAQLSGGEKQRLALAAALLLDRPICVIDEITSALDDYHARVVLRALSRRTQLTVLGSTHAPALFEGWAAIIPLGGHAKEN